MILHVIGLDAVNKSYSLGDGVIKLLFYGGSYWFLYALYILFLVYPFVEKICNKPWKELLFAVACAIIYNYVATIHFLNINRFFYYVPFFVTGRYVMRFIKSDYSKVHLLNIAIFVSSLIIYYTLGKSELYFIKYVRAFSVSCALYVIAHYSIILVDKGVILLELLERLLANCSLYSLQLYLFNGFLLTAIRHVVCSVFHITSPIVIVSAILVGNVVITLLICNYVLPHTKIISWLCGTGERK